jgi:hypothetical protein
MSGDILTHPHTPSWRGAQLIKKHRENFSHLVKVPLSTLMRLQFPPYFRARNVRTLPAQSVKSLSITVVLRNPSLLIRILTY